MIYTGIDHASVTLHQSKVGNQQVICVQMNIKHSQ